MRGSIFSLTVLGAVVTGAPDAHAAPTPVGELVVRPEAKCLPARKVASSAEPRIVSTFPADGAVIRPGRLVIRVTFDRPMTCSGFFVNHPMLPNPCPPLRQKMVLTLDRRTVRLLCATAPDTAYGVQVGDNADEAFVSLDGHAATPYALNFKTSSGPPVATVPEALAQDR